MAKRAGGKAYYMISAVSQKYNIHPQTLRLYEREGLLKPSRTDGNTRLYSEEDLEQLETIHEHLTKAEVYRGFAVPGVALVGVLGLLGAAAMDQVTSVSDPARFVRYWLLIAAVGAALGLGATAHSYLVREDEVARRKTRRVLAQFLPCLGAGGLVTATASPRVIGTVPQLLWSARRHVCTRRCRRYDNQTVVPSRPSYE